MKPAVQNKRPASGGQRKPGGGRKRKRPMTLGEAIAAELKDMFGGALSGAIASVSAQDVARAAIAAVLLIVLAAMQPTVFSRFKPFGAVPDIMLCFTVAIGFSEGERFGGIVGLISAFVIESIGGVGITLLPLLYMPCGFIAGVLSKDVLDDTLLSRAVLITGASFGRAIISVIYSLVTFEAGFVDIILKIAVPEFFATVLLSVPVCALVWICYRYFHKTRAERTEKIR